MCTTLTMPPKRNVKQATHRTTPRAPVHPGDGLSPAQQRKVRHVRDAIAAGEYENELKLQVTIERLLDVFN